MKCEDKSAVRKAELDALEDFNTNYSNYITSFPDALTGKGARIPRLSIEQFNFSCCEEDSEFLNKPSAISLKTNPSIVFPNAFLFENNRDGFFTCDVGEFISGWFTMYSFSRPEGSDLAPNARMILKNSCGKLWSPFCNYKESESQDWLEGMDIPSIDFEGRFVCCETLFSVVLNRQFFIFEGDSSHLDGLQDPYYQTVTHDKDSPNEKTETFMAKKDIKEHARNWDKSWSNPVNAPIFNAWLTNPVLEINLEFRWNGCRPSAKDFNSITYSREIKIWIDGKGPGKRGEIISSWKAP